MSVSLQQLIDHNRVTPRVLTLMQQTAIEAIEQYRAEGGKGLVTTHAFVFSDDLRALRFAPLDESPAPYERADLRAYGDVLMNAIIATKTRPKRLIAIAQECINGDFSDYDDLVLALEKRMSNTIYIPIIAIVLILLLLMWALAR